MRPIVMVDLQQQHEAIKTEIDQAIQRVIQSSQFIKGPEVINFEGELAKFLATPYVISCANGTDALLLALRALEIKPGDEVIVPSFTFIATAEVVALLGAIPVFADVNPETFNIDPTRLESLITQRTRAIIPVHLFGQSANMEAIMDIAEKYHLFVIEDTAQALGATCMYRGKQYYAGTIGHIGATSFFPSKNLGCMGDGGAVFTHNEALAKKIRLLANHGAENKYFHLTLGTNSRLDAIQAAILRVKLKYLKTYLAKRQQAAQLYNEQLAKITSLKLPHLNSSHTFNQYTITLLKGNRTELQEHLKNAGIPSTIYYPLPLHLQPAFKYLNYKRGSLPISEQLSEKVLSLPMHSELDEEQITFIVNQIINYYNR